MQKVDLDIYGCLTETRTEAQHKENTGFWNPSPAEVAIAAKSAYDFLQSSKEHPEIAFPYLVDYPKKNKDRVIKNAKNEIGLVIKITVSIKVKTEDL